MFLDEVAQLDPLVQSKLLRVLESREVLPLGASRSQKVEIRICAASHKKLRDEVTAGRFREDLYFRIGRPEVQIPALRERIDEIPWLIERELSAVDARLSPSVTFVEACALRSWPGNVRELLGEIRRAAHRALEEEELVVSADHLAGEAGNPFSKREPATLPKTTGASWTDEQIAKALAENGGNVRGTARALGMHRNQLRRWLDKHREAQVPGGSGSTLPPTDS
jgi:transcriptional regulator with PAS, ATPase and Fis domain